MRDPTANERSVSESGIVSWRPEAAIETLPKLPFSIWVGPSRTGGKWIRKQIKPLSASSDGALVMRAMGDYGNLAFGGQGGDLLVVD